jgi:hypothetical protein
MTVKLKDIKITYNLTNAEQIGSKQLFCGHSEIYKRYIYVSYRTIIAIKHNGQCHITSEYFSSTTTRHKHAISKMESQCIVVNKFNDLLQGIRVDNLLVS